MFKLENVVVALRDCRIRLFVVYSTVERRQTDKETKVKISVVQVTLLLEYSAMRLKGVITYAYIIILAITQFRCRALQLRTYCSG
jgi:hypothetical protein